MLPTFSSQSAPSRAAFKQSNRQFTTRATPASWQYVGRIALLAMLSVVCGCGQSSPPPAAANQRAASPAAVPSPAPAVEERQGPATEPMAEKADEAPAASETDSQERAPAADSADSENEKAQPAETPPEPSDEPAAPATAAKPPADDAERASKKNDAPSSDAVASADKPKPAEQPEPPPAKPGLAVNDPRAQQGYTLLSPLTYTKTFLIDIEGRIVKTWESEYSPALCAYLLENGNVLRQGAVREKPPEFNGPGSGGWIQEFTWDGELVWDLQLVFDKQFPHHDITRLPNGNLLVIAWDLKSEEQAVAAGRRPETVKDGYLLSDSILEIKPTGRSTGEVVWEWRLWDHLIQDHDQDKANYGEVSEHPELVDVNFNESTLAPILASPAAVDKLKSIGYVGGGATPPAPPGGQAPPGGGPPGPPRINPEWTHFNGVAYNPELDQIAISVHAFSEFWIIDHGTTTAEAASHTGGKRGRGGDLLYRWGNPRAYRCGTNADQRLFAQHNAHWIAPGLPGEGHILVFNNGGRRPDGSYSSVDEIVLPLKDDGTYELDAAGAYGPEQAEWSYTAPNKPDFFSMIISGAQRLANGDTLICQGVTGRVFEVTPDKEIVWEYTNPIKGSGMPGIIGPPPFVLGRLLPGFLRRLLKLSPEQNQTLDKIEHAMADRLATVLTEEQQRKLKEPPEFGPGGRPGPGGPPAPGAPAAAGAPASGAPPGGATPAGGAAAAGAASPGAGAPPGPGGPPVPGELLPAALRSKLELTDEQTAQIDELQKQADDNLAELLTKEQLAGLKSMQERFRRALPPPFGGPPPGGGPPGGGPPGVAGPGGLGAPPGGPSGVIPGGPAAGGPRGGGQPFPAGFGRPAPGSSLFRCYRYTADYPGLSGNDLTPGETLEEYQARIDEAKKQVVSDAEPSESQASEAEPEKDKR